MADEKIKKTKTLERIEDKLRGRTKWYFLALHFHLRDIPLRERKKRKEELAELVDMKYQSFNEHTMARRIGSENMRAKVALFFDYEEYADFIDIGRELEKNGFNLDQAKQTITQAKKLRFEPDGYIERIAKDWKTKTTEDKLEMRRVSRFQEFKRSSFYDDYKKTDSYSEERFLSLWGSVSKTPENAELDANTLKLINKYKEKTITDKEVLEYADDFFSNL